MTKRRQIARTVGDLKAFLEDAPEDMDVFHIFDLDDDGVDEGVVVSFGHFNTKKKTLQSRKSKHTERVLKIE